MRANRVIKVGHVSKRCKQVSALVGGTKKKCANYSSVKKVGSLRDLPRRGFWSSDQMVICQLAS